MEKITIPENMIQVCRDMAKVAREHGLNKFSARFNPPIFGEWNGDISFAWEAGRHNEAADQINITSQIFIHTKVNPTTNE